MATLATQVEKMGVNEAGEAPSSSAAAGQVVAGAPASTSRSTNGRVVAEVDKIAKKPALSAAELKAQRDADKEKADRAAKKMEKLARGRQKFEFKGRTVYEWDQSLEEVRIYVKPPPTIKARDIACKITSTHLSLGLKGADKPFIDEDFFSRVKVDESDWMMSDGEIEINLQKMNKAQTWESALLGHGEMNAYVKGEVQKALMLERFGAENPGFE